MINSTTARTTPTRTTGRSAWMPSCAPAPGGAHRARRHRHGDRRGDLVRVLFPGVRAARGRAMTERRAPRPSAMTAPTRERVERRWATVAVAIVGRARGHGGVRRGARGHHAAEPRRDGRSAHAASPRRVHREQSRQRARSRTAPSPCARSASNIPSRRNASWCRPTRRSRSALTSADVVHGFLITGTNINLMLVPATSPASRRASRRRASATCRATSSAASGHEGMWGRVKIIDKAAFAADGGRSAEAELC